MTVWLPLLSRTHTHTHITPPKIPSEYFLEFRSLQQYPQKTTQGFLLLPEKCFRDLFQKAFPDSWNNFLNFTRKKRCSEIFVFRFFDCSEFSTLSVSGQWLAQQITKFPIPHSPDLFHPKASPKISDVSDFPILPPIFRFCEFLHAFPTCLPRFLFSRFVGFSELLSSTIFQAPTRPFPPLEIFSEFFRIP